MSERFPIRAKALVEVELEKDDLATALVEEALKEVGLKMSFRSNSLRDYFIGEDGVSIFKRAHNYGPYDDPDELLGKSEKAASLLLAAFALGDNSYFPYQWKSVTSKITEEIK